MIIQSFLILFSSLAFSVEHCPQVKEAPVQTKLNRSAGKRHPITALSKKQADAAFNYVKNRKHQIPYDYHYAGCEIRAYFMSYLLNQKNIKTVRYSAESKEGSLEINTTSTQEGYTEYPFHTSTAVCVFDPETKKTSLMVFDPSLFNKPIEVSEFAPRLERDRTFKEGDVGRVGRTWFSSMQTKDPSQSNKGPKFQKSFAAMNRVRAALWSEQVRIEGGGEKPSAARLARPVE